MTNFWIFPFAMIGYWFVGAIIELIRTPTPRAAIGDNRMNLHPSSN